MINASISHAIGLSMPPCNLFGQAERPLEAEQSGDGEMELWLYRGQTIRMLRRYARASIEVGRLPSLLGREFFRSQISSGTRRNFEDVVIFVADMERAIERLSPEQKNLLAMSVLEEYTIPDIALLIGCNEKTVRRTLPDAVDQLSEILLGVGLLQELPRVTGSFRSCQGPKKRTFGVSNSKEGVNKLVKNVQSPLANLIS
jgi:RNA polymerase sigma factor (sigma-70 family)